MKRVGVAKNLRVKREGRGQRAIEEKEFYCG